MWGTARSAVAVSLGTLVSAILANSADADVATRPTRVSLAPAPDSPRPYGEDVYLSAALSPHGVPGVVRWYDGSALLATSSSFQDMAVTHVTTLAVGIHEIKVTFTPNDVSSYSASAATAPYVIAGGHLVDAQIAPDTRPRPHDGSSVSFPRVDASSSTTPPGDPQPVAVHVPAIGVKGTHHQSNPDHPTGAVGAVGKSGGGGDQHLPLTGIDPGGLIADALIATCLGAALVYLGRRRRSVGAPLLD